MSKKTSSKTTSDLSSYAYALDVSGFTRIRAQVTGRELDLLRECADRATARSFAIWRSGQALAYTDVNEYYHGARCMYCWGDPCVRIMEHETVHALAELTIGSGYRLWDLTVLSVLPTPLSIDASQTWHRDYGGIVWGAPSPAYLWFFLCLDDVTTENGATWVVPGSHRRLSAHESSGPVLPGEQMSQHTMSIQLCAKAGDILVMNPTIIHNSGHNHSNGPRRLLNIGLCHGIFPPLMNHWAIAGPDIRANASPRLRAFLGADRKPLDTTWTALPQEWQTE